MGGGGRGRRVHFASVIDLSAFKSPPLIPFPPPCPASAGLSLSAVLASISHIKKKKKKLASGYAAVIACLTSR